MNTKMHLQLKLYHKELIKLIINCGLQDEKKTKVSFGTVQDRKLFPLHMAPDRFGNEVKPVKGFPQTGPGRYDNENFTNLEFQVKSKLTSSRGYTMGARTAPRMRKEFIEVTPSPQEYQEDLNKLREFTPTYKPFLHASDRFPVFKKDIEEASPGAGTYEHDISKNRHVQWHQSFGGAPVLMPPVEIQSTIGQNTNKLLSTREAKRYNRKLAYLKLYY